jgi:Uncharacterized membrane protein, required for spore maturation in B.subtilis.
MLRLSQAIVDEAGHAVTLAFGLIGIMALFMGLLRVAEAGGLLHVLARLLRRPMLRLFPQVPADHPAMGAMILNMAANVLGLGNAATPFGLKAMRALDQINPVKGTASNAMVMFLAINTANVTLLPTNVIALRAAAGSADPAGVTVTTLFATTISTLVAIVVAKLGQSLWPAAAAPAPAPPDRNTAETPDPQEATEPVAADDGYPMWVAVLAGLSVLASIPLLIVFGPAFGAWLIPTLVTGFIVFALVRRVAVYEVLVDGAREGFDVAVRIIPYLVAILVAIGMLKASGALDDLLHLIAPVTTPLGVPPQAVLMTFLRSLSGSGAYAYLASVLNDPAVGPDSYTGYLVSTIQGSTETTFYVLAVYCGAAGVRRLRHAVVAGLTADLAGLVAAVFICQWLYGR